MKNRKCRKRIFFYTLKHYLSYYTGQTVFIPVLGYTLLILIPAVTYGCTPAYIRQDTPEANTVLRLMKSAEQSFQEEGAADILMFNDDRMQRLDSYQRVPLTQCSTIKAVSSAGRKIMAVFFNAQKNPDDWTGVNSYESLEEICVNLEQETREKEAMSGEYRGKAGYPANVTMQRLASEIILRSISCDFKGRPYEGHPLMNARAYLTNVNAEAQLISSHPYIPRRMINVGGHDREDIERFEEPGLICHDFPYNIGQSVIRPDIRFRCYPNEVPEEYPGSPFTRLVIEGQIDGKTYFWPININREGAGNGIERNKRYFFDIRITRTGHSTADIPVETGLVQIKTEIQEWEEREEYGVRF